MTFFSRPDLSDIQFKQLDGSVLTLSGQTRIVSSTGLTLTDGSGSNIIITASGASTVGHVLTFDGTVIKLSPSAASGATMYNPPYQSPASINLGGISSGTTLTGKTISWILQQLLVPTQYPTLTNPSSTFTIFPTATIYEVGASVTISGTTTLNRGCINPQYNATCNLRSGLPSAHLYIPFGLTEVTATTTNLSKTCSFIHTIQPANNTISGRVAYSIGVQPYDSSGGTYCTPLSAGATTTTCRVICGLYPWYWGSSGTTPSIGQSLINGGNKCVGSSTGCIVVDNYNVVGQYIWFAIPTASTIKTKWQGCNSPSNCGTIPGDLFASGVTCSVNSPQSCWSTISYKFYRSNYPTSINYGMTFKNS